MDPTITENLANPQAPGISIWRRLGAVLYDSLLLFGLLTLASAILLVLYSLLTVWYQPAGGWLFLIMRQVGFLAVIAGFFVYFWTHGGQTLGMRSWRLRVVRADGGPLTVRDALRRLGWAALSLLPAGLGLWWCLFDREHLAWHDRRSATHLVLVPRGG